jgi:hypothetical protein
LKSRESELVSEIIDVIVTLAAPRRQGKLVSELQYNTVMVEDLRRDCGEENRKERIGITRVP